MGFFTGDDGGSDGAGFDHGEGEGILRFQGGKSTGGREGRLPEHCREVAVIGQPGGVDETVEDEVEFPGSGQGEVDAGNLALELGCQCFPNPKEDEELAGGPGVAEGVPHLAVQEGIFFLKVSAEIPQEDDSIVLKLGDVFQRSHRIGAGLGGA